MATPNKFYLSNTKLPRRTRSPFRYPGGKFYALKYILPYILCVPHDEYREPFVGGGTIFFGKPKSRFNWLNDLESKIMNIYRVMADKKTRALLTQRLAKETINPKRHKQVKCMTTKSSLESAFKTYYLNRTSYSGIIKKAAWGYQVGKSSPPRNWGKFLNDAGERLSDVKLTSYDFEKIITAKPKGGKILMYLDPPYYHTDQKRAYTKPFVIKDHKRLAGLLKKTVFLFCLSYDDCEEIRNLYSWAVIHEETWLYNTANCKGKSRKNGKELIITNYELQPARVKQLKLF